MHCILISTRVYYYLIAVSFSSISCAILVLHLIDVLEMYKTVGLGKPNHSTESPHYRE